VKFGSTENLLDVLTQYGDGPQGQVASMLFGGTQRNDNRVDAGGKGLLDLRPAHLE
jgi:hypothetical protein